MTPAERAVIDAARALEKSGGTPAYDALMAAVRALPRPLSEQLAELRVGAVVEDCDGSEFIVFANHKSSRTLVCDWLDGTNGEPELVPYERVAMISARIISNPEESDG